MTVNINGLEFKDGICLSNVFAECVHSNNVVCVKTFVLFIVIYKFCYLLT